MTDTDPAATPAPIRDVRVQSRSRHTPAHRIVDPPTDDTPHAMYAVACPPYLMTGGIAITRDEAASLAAFPCRQCFPGTRR